MSKIEVAILMGSIAEGFCIEQIAGDLGTAQSIVAAHLASGRIAEAIEVQRPSSLHEREKNHGSGDQYVVFGSALGSGFTLYGPFPDQDQAEDFGERRRGEDEEWELFVPEIAHADGASLGQLSKHPVDEGILKSEVTVRDCASLGNDELLAEVARRGLLTDLHGAVGALYDNLAANGTLDGESDTTAYLAYRLRREDAKLGIGQGASDVTDYWQQQIDAMGR